MTPATPDCCCEAAGVPPQAGPVEALEEPVPAAGEDLPPPEEEAPEEVGPSGVV